MNIRILFDCHTFDMEPQGTSTFLAGLINAIPKTVEKYFPGHCIEIYCASSNEANVSAYVHVPHKFEKIKSGFVARNILWLPKAAWDIKADVVVSQYVRPLWVPKYSASVIHDLLFLDFPGQFKFTYRFSRQILFGLAAKLSSKVFTVSEYSRERIAKIFHVDASSIVVLPNAVPPSVESNSQFYGKSIRGSALRLLYVSRLEMRKRQSWCVRALSDLLDDGLDIELTIVGGGSGEYAENMRRFLEEKRLEFGGRLKHLEGITSSELKEEYLSSDIFLFPSLGEGFGIPVIEAAAYGLPCVVTDGSALAELRPFYAGCDFKSDDYEGFLAGIRLVANNLQSYKEEAQEIRRSVVARFSWESTAQEFIKSMLQLSARA